MGDVLNGKNNKTRPFEKLPMSGIIVSDKVPEIKEMAKILASVAPYFEENDSAMKGILGCWKGVCLLESDGLRPATEKVIGVTSGYKVLSDSLVIKDIARSLNSLSNLVTEWHVNVAGAVNQATQQLVKVCLGEVVATDGRSSLGRKKIFGLLNACSQYLCQGKLTSLAIWGDEAVADWAMDNFHSVKCCPNCVQRQGGFAVSLSITEIHVMEV